MKRKLYYGIAVILVLVLCFGILKVRTSSATSEPAPVEIGDHIDLGTYQGSPIEWRVLDIDPKNGTILLLSEYGLDAKSYNEDAVSDIKWKDCTLRQWLNDDFFKTAFTKEEQGRILLSESKGFTDCNSRVPGLPYDYLERETEDRIFLLSYTELSHYIVTPEPNGMYACEPTEHAKKSESLILSNLDRCGWWLCAGVSYMGNNSPCFVSAYSGIDVEKVEHVNAAQYAVRPAMWVKWQEEEDEA